MKKNIEKLIKQNGQEKKKKKTKKRESGSIIIHVILYPGKTQMKITFCYQ